MNEIIGVMHVDWNLEKLIELIDLNFGTPKSLMLELPPNWRELKGRWKDLEGRLNKLPYFFKLANEYEKRGTEIIAGDKNYYVIEPQYSKEYLEFEEKLRKVEMHPETIKEWKKSLRIVIGELIRYNAILGWNLLHLSKHKKKNEGILEVFDETNPELTVVGGAHARFLRNHRHDIHYTFFMTDSLFEKIDFGVGYILGFAKADSYIVLPHSTS